MLIIINEWFEQKWSRAIHIIHTGFGIFSHPHPVHEIGAKCYSKLEEAPKNRLSSGAHVSGVTVFE
jgi:hypothetical protein